MEYGALDESTGVIRSFASSRASRSTLEASATVWHKMLGHLGPDTIKHLEKGVDNVKVIRKAPFTTKCETYALIKAHRVIS